MGADGRAPGAETLTIDERWCGSRARPSRARAYIAQVQALDGRIPGDLRLGTPVSAVSARPFDTVLTLVYT